MAEYSLFKKGKLVLKGGKSGVKRKKSKHAKDSTKTDEKVNTDVIAHGGWASADFITDITGSICIEFGQHSYVKALDNGCFIIGPPHDEGEGPSPEEILTAVAINEERVAFKSGYGKYLSFDKDGNVVGKSDAIGQLEHWEPIFQDGKLALLSKNGCFMSAREADDAIIVTSQTASDREFVRVRYMASTKVKDPLENVPLEERGDVSEIEVNYVRKFQKFQDKKLRISSGTKIELKNAKTEGTLHETLLDRRSKMKSDRYCK